MRRLLLAFVVIALPTHGLAAAAMTCTDPATGEKKPIRVGEVKRGLKKVRKRMLRDGIHILDLPESVQERHEWLPQFVKERNWCVVRSHVVAVEDALGMLRIDQAFVSEKFSRVERWVRAGLSDPTKREKADRFMANAAAHMADRRFEKANWILNKVMTVIFGSGDLFKLPKNIPEPAEGKGSAAISPSIKTAEVAAGCPILSEQGRATKQDLASRLKKLRELMDKRKIRALDVQGGEQLVADLQSYQKLSATWPATRIACAMLDRAGNAEIGLGLVMKRFQRVNKLREQRGVPEGKKEQFTTLVRSATDHIAIREFAEAHRALEELLILLGEPIQPSSGLP